LKLAVKAIFIRASQSRLSWAKNVIAYKVLRRLAKIKAPQKWLKLLWQATLSYEDINPDNVDITNHHNRSSIETHPLNNTPNLQIEPVIGT
jgi:hypothetical protein